MGFLNKSKYGVYIAGCLMGLVSAQFGYTREYQIDQSHSSVGFVSRHMMSKVPGSFADFEGDFTFDEKNIKNSKVKAVIKSASINTLNTKRDEHLRSPDFFEVTKHPKMTFTSTKVTTEGAGKYKIAGDFTMRGVTKPVVLDAEFLGEQDDPWGGHRAAFSAIGKINRKDYGMVWNKALDKGGVVLSDEIEIVINVEGLEKSPAKK